MYLINIFIYAFSILRVLLIIPVFKNVSFIYLFTYLIIYLYVNFKIKIYKTILLPVLLYGYEAWSFT